MPIVLLKKRHFKQELKASCVAAAARMLLDFHGIASVSEAELRRILKTKPTGTNILNLLFLRDEKRWDLNVEVSQSTIDELFARVSQDRIPVVVFVDTEPFPFWDESADHVVLVVGYDKEAVIINDPNFENHEIYVPFAKFFEAWRLKDNYMVVIKKKKG